MKQQKVLQIDEDESRLVTVDKTKQTTGQQTANMTSIAMELGFSITVPIVAGAFLGMYLDKKFGTTPRLTLSLLLLGVFSGTYSLIRIVLKELQKMNKK